MLISIFIFLFILKTLKNDYVHMLYFPDNNSLHIRHRPVNALCLSQLYDFVVNTFILHLQVWFLSLPKLHILPVFLPQSSTSPQAPHDPETLSWVKLIMQHAHSGHCFLFKSHQLKDSIVLLFYWYKCPKMIINMEQQLNIYCNTDVYKCGSIAFHSVIQ